eukprot:NODE_10506_length_1346_cov_7.370796.p1 GENE.NODE_10506_length_1346_cov_7.370796~~NODE_10506_length_1346_cov_7.370796.p1  ORF type:complete len:385 (+),score=36.52 NODE_10506_length_1346_cov_7.370796:102-1256(+)
MAAATRTACSLFLGLFIVLLIMVNNLLHQRLPPQLAARTMERCATKDRWRGGGDDLDPMPHNAELSSMEEEEEEEEECGGELELNADVDELNAEYVDELDEHGNVLPSLAVAGLMSSGTHLLHKLLVLAFGISRVQHDVPALTRCLGKSDDKHNPLEVGCSDFWKHAQPWRIINCGRVPPKTLVVVVRNPIAQIASLKRMPFNLWPCFPNLLEECSCFPSCSGSSARECRFSRDQKYYPCNEVKGGRNLSRNFAKAAKDLPPVGEDVKYPNLMEVWNSYVSGYFALAELTRRVVIVRYEDLVFTPDKVLANVSKAIGLPAPEHTPLLTGKARGFDSGSHDRAGSVKLITNKEYRKSFDAATLEAMCKGLSRSLLEKLGYADECQ